MKFKTIFLTSIILFIANNASAKEFEGERDKLHSCLKKANTQPTQSLEDGRMWKFHGGGIFAEYCMAVSRIGMGEYEKGARRLVTISHDTQIGNKEDKLSMLIKASNAFLLANLPIDAKSSIEEALTLSPDEPNLLIDRARTNLMLGDNLGAENDVTKAMEIKGIIPLGLRLRAEARTKLEKFDLASQDIEEAIKLEPKEPANLIIRGHLREAIRLKKK